MSVPEHLWRFPTTEARVSLAKRFGLPYSDQMQDWEYEVADANRIDEFISVYESGELDDDEKFSLMETIIQSFEDLEISLSDEPRWQRVLNLIENNIELHRYTVWYWSMLENSNKFEQWRVTPFIESILIKHKEKFS
ncbi:MAG: hypothetical protein PVI82_16535 [Desulfobacterales bacterium]